MIAAPGCWVPLLADWVCSFGLPRDRMQEERTPMRQMREILRLALYDPQVNRIGLMAEMGGWILARLPPQFYGLAELNAARVCEGALESSRGTASRPSPLNLGGGGRMKARVGGGFWI